jgi:ubiquitin carboxyl-terminal hydrolase L5
LLTRQLGQANHKGKTTENLCATVALLNIVNNIPSLELGEPLQQFKNFSMTLTPAMRGYALSQNFEFARQVHNSFAKRRDMLNADLILARETKRKQMRGKGMSASDDSNELSFHFVAFVPVNGILWMMDGMDRQPQNMGQATEDWLDLARPLLEARMLQYGEDQIHFALMGVVRDPLTDLCADLGSNIKSLQKLTEKLNHEASDWKGFLTNEDRVAEDSLLTGPSQHYRLTEKMISDAVERDQNVEDTKDPALKMQRIMAARACVIKAQMTLRMKIQEELSNELAETDFVNKCRFDHTPAIQKWLELLAGKPEMESLLAKHVL